VQSFRQRLRIPEVKVKPIAGEGQNHGSLDNTGVQT
jgi:hypothetical protein